MKRSRNYNIVAFMVMHQIVPFFMLIDSSFNKRLVLYLIVFYTSLTAMSQEFENEGGFNPETYKSSNPTAAELYLKLSDYNGKPVSYYDVWLNEAGLKSKISGVTDAKGNVTFRVTKGKNYNINLEDSANFSNITIPTGFKYTYTKKINFFPSEKYYSRITTTDTVRQNINKRIEVPLTDVLFQVTLRDNKNSTMQYKEIRMYCRQKNKLFIAKTSSTGEASLLIPANSDFVVGIDELDSYSQFNTNKMGGGNLQSSFNYVPLNFTEKIIRDTVTQVLPKNLEPTSARIFITVKLMNPERELLENEPVFFKSRTTNLTYKCYTGKDGIAYCLVPKGDIYNVSFKYETNIDVLEYPYDNVMRRTRIEYTYLGSKRIEEYYASIPKKQGFITEFMDRKIETVEAFPATIIEKTNYGYNLDFNTGSEISPPLIYNQDMLVMTGYYKPEFYSVNASSGKCNWGIRLAENGSSPVVCEDGVFLVNTQSCTLYAIDAKFGKLLWSKWLGPVINTTPTVSNGLVYTCYPRNVGSDFLRKDSAFVMIAFKLKTGEIAWQKWLDGEIVGAPVIAGNLVYATTDNESIFSFDKNTGKQISMKSGGYISSPTVVGDQLYVFKRDGRNAKTSVLNYMSANDLKLLGSANFLKASVDVSLKGKGSFSLMNFNENRLVHSKGKNYCIADGVLYCISKSDNKLLWQKVIYDINKIEKKYLNSLPVLAGGKVIVASPMGKLLFFDSQSGEKLQEYSFSGEMLIDAIAHNGWVYCGTTQGRVISVNTKNAAITGWPGWSFNSSHNPVVN